METETILKILGYQGIGNIRVKVIGFSFVVLDIKAKRITQKFLSQNDGEVLNWTTSDLPEISIPNICEAEQYFKMFCYNKHFEKNIVQIIISLITE